MLDQENKEKQPIHSIPIGYVFKLNRNVFILRIPKKEEEENHTFLFNHSKY